MGRQLQHRFVNAQQAALLRAALQAGPAAARAWKQWTSEVAFDAIDSASYQLLPLVYTNLREQSVLGSLEGRLRGVHRRTWLLSNLLGRQLIEIGQVFEESGLPWLVLGGAASVHTVYPDPALRPVVGVELVVRPQDLGTVGACFGKLDYQPNTGRRRTLLTGRLRRHCDDIFYRSDATPVILSSRVHREGQPAGKSRTWQDAQRVPLDSAQRFAAPLPADLLFDALLSMSGPHPVLRVLAICDVVQLLRAAEGVVDFERVCEQARSSRSVAAINAAVQYLANASDLVASASLQGLRPLQAGPVRASDAVRQWCRGYLDEATESLRLIL